MTELHNFELRQSTDEVKRDLELTCTSCGEHICDAEPGDRIDVLVAECQRHTDEAGHPT